MKNIYLKFNIYIRYELSKKIFKYKSKYLNLTQKGGYNNIKLKLSRGYDIINKNIIKQNDKIVITECSIHTEKIDIFNKNTTSFNYKLVDNSMYMNLIAVIEEISYTKDYMVTLKIKYDNNGIEHTYTFDSNIFDTIYFYKLDMENKNPSENNIKLLEQVNQSEKIIKELQDKIANLESQLKNHYHDLPTSGMKFFIESHPYLKKSD